MFDLLGDAIESLAPPVDTLPAVPTDGAGTMPAAVAAGSPPPAATRRPRWAPTTRSCPDGGRR